MNLFILLAASAQAAPPVVTYQIADIENESLGRRVLPLFQKALPLQDLEKDVAAFLDMKPDYFSAMPVSVTLRDFSESRLSGVKGEIYTAEVDFTASEPNLQWGAIETVAIHSDGGNIKAFYRSPAFQGDCGATFYHLATSGTVNLGKAEYAILKVITGLAGCATDAGATQELLKFFDVSHGLSEVSGEFETSYSNTEEAWEAGHPWREGKVTSKVDLTACLKKACDAIAWEKESTFGGAPKKTHGMLKISGDPPSLYIERR